MANTEEDLALVRRAIEVAIRNAVANQESQAESFWQAIYDAVSLRPGMLGVSVDLKRLLEHWKPDIREKLRGRPSRRDPFTLLQAFVTPSGCRQLVRISDAEKILGAQTLDALVASTILRYEPRGDERFVELTHDLIVQVIHDPHSLLNDEKA